MYLILKIYIQMKIKLKSICHTKDTSTFDLFPWEKCLLVLLLCTYSKEDDLPRFDVLFCLVGRGAGKNGFISFLCFCLMTETNGIPNYNIDIVANTEDQAKTSFHDVYNVLTNPE